MTITHGCFSKLGLLSEGVLRIGDLFFGVTIGPLGFWKLKYRLLYIYRPTLNLYTCEANVDNHVGFYNLSVPSNLYACKANVDNHVGFYHVPVPSIPTVPSLEVSETTRSVQARYVDEIHGALGRTVATLSWFGRSTIAKHDLGVS